MKIAALSQARPVVRGTSSQSELPVEAALNTPLDKVELSTQQATPNAEGLKATSEKSAWQAISSAALGGLWHLALGVSRPIKELAHTGEFALGFIRKLRTRATEITHKNSEVKQRLETEGLHQAYEQPHNAVTTKLRGKMTIKASMSEFYKLWDFWIDQGYGSINDRQYADVVREHSQKAKNLPLLKYLPVTSVDSFTAEIKDGKMLSMTETTKAKLGGLIPTNTVDWTYRRQGDPAGANSFEHTVDRFNGDLGKVQDFYQKLFDPKRLDPNSKATVDFVVEKVDDIPALAPSDKEFEHSVKVPGGFLLPKSSELLSEKRDPKMVEKYGPWAVVTGASGGLGGQYAEVLAEKGLNVVLVARGGKKLQETALELEKKYQVKTRVVAADLTRPEAIKELQAQTDDLEVGLLVNNAGMWQFGSFLDNNVDRDAASIALNTEAPLRLTHHFAGKMKDRGKGGVINVGSGAGLHGVPSQATYSATKGFMLNFSEALYRELKPHGVDVLVTNPGPIEGDAAEAYDQSKNPLEMVSGREVAVDSLKRLGKKSSTIPGWFNKLALGGAVRLMPRDMLASIAGYILEKASEK